MDVRLHGTACGFARMVVRMETALAAHEQTPARQAWWRRVPLTIVLVAFVVGCAGSPFMAKWYFAAAKGGDAYLIGFVESPSTPALVAIGVGAILAPPALLVSYAIAFMRTRWLLRVALTLSLLAAAGSTAIIYVFFGVRLEL